MGWSVETIGALIIAIAALVTALSTMRKTRVDYSSAVVSGFNTLLENYTAEIKRLSTVNTENNQEHTNELKALADEHKKELEKLQNYYIDQLASVTQKVTLLERTVSEQQKTINNQARKITRLEEGAA